MKKYLFLILCFINNAIASPLACTGNVATDTANIQAAAAAITSTNNVLELDACNWVVNSNTDLITINNVNGFVLKGQGQYATTITQLGTGNLLTLNGTSEITGAKVSDLYFEGNGTAYHGIVSTNLKDSVIERVTIRNARYDGIQFFGAANLHNVVRDSRIVVLATDDASACNISQYVGTTLTVQNTYMMNFLAGGGTMISTLAGSPGSPTGSDGLTTIGNIFEGNANAQAIRLTGNSTHHGDVLYTPFNAYILKGAGNALVVTPGRGVTRALVRDNTGWGNFTSTTKWNGL